MLQLPHCNKSFAGPDPAKARTDKKDCAGLPANPALDSFHCNTHLKSKFQSHATHYVVHFSVGAIICTVLCYSRSKRYRGACMCVYAHRSCCSALNCPPHFILLQPINNAFAHPQLSLARELRGLRISAVHNKGSLPDMQGGVSVCVCLCV